jgi:hypothetical protein
MWSKKSLGGGLRLPSRVTPAARIDTFASRSYDSRTQGYGRGEARGPAPLKETSWR